MGGRKLDDKTGQRFGRLTVLEYIGLRGKASMWRCRCACGTEKVVAAGGLTRGTTRSCGCLNSEASAARKLKHGQARRGRISPEFRSWVKMIERCYDPNCPGFKDYGARGITICDRWRESFENFYADMGKRPPGTSIDRIDVNGHYEPGNCRWATDAQQARNQRRTRLTEDDARRIKELRAAGLKYKDVAAHFPGVPPATIYSVIGGHTWRDVTP